MACRRCSAPCQGRLCAHCELERSHEGMSAGDLGWRRDEADEEGERDD